jgi:hypothetical protein
MILLTIRPRITDAERFFLSRSLLLFLCRESSYQQLTILMGGEMILCVLFSIKIL